MRLRSLTLTPLLALIVLSGLAFVAASASAETTGPQWTVTSVARPTNFAPASTGRDEYVVLVTNTGSGPSDGSPVVVTDELPSGLSLDSAGASGEYTEATVNIKTGAKVECILDSCSYAAVVAPDESLEVEFPVDVSAPAGTVVKNFVRVSGGGASSPGSVETPTTVSTAPAPFGLSPGGVSTALSSAQAGAHPDLTTAFAFNTVNEGGALAGDPKDTTDELPAGFAADLVDTPTCSAAAFLQSECPIVTQVGVTTLDLASTGRLTGPQIRPVYNLAPGPGEAAKIGFIVGAEFFFEGNITLTPGVYPEGYRARATFHNAPEGLNELDGGSLTLWGVPADPTHDLLRYVPQNSHIATGHFGVSSDAPRVPYFTSSTVCGMAPLEAQFTVNSWEQPGQYVGASMPFGPLAGCDRLGIEPSLTGEATSSSASAASGLVFGITVPQTYENPEGIATSALKKAVVTLPEGMTVNPSAGAGLGACTPAQFAEEGVQFAAGQGCPNESKLGTVKIQTPLLKEEATGTVFIAQPYDNPFNSLIALYVVARIPNRGVLVKTAGEVQANPVTGQLVTTFDQLPPLPFSAFTFSFRQGATSPLVTPPACGQYTVQAALTPWSDPEGIPLMPPIPSFPISSGAGGGACPAGGVPPFSPTLTAGTLNNAAGSYSPLDIRISRQDGEQEITGFAAQFPAGLTGNLSGVEKCSEADVQHARAQTGVEAEGSPSCPKGSEIGYSIAEAGVGSVLAQTPGKIYLGEGYEGAPFSVVAVTAAHVGPFDLGTVVIHFPLDINPVTAAVTIPAGQADQIPHIIKGIVIHVRNIHAYINRSDFMLNPTSCNPASLSATVIGGGANPVNPAGYDPVTVSSPFQAADCSSLKFEPKFTASTEAKDHFNENGASLTVKLAANQGPNPTTGQGVESNISKVKVELPISLPSRLTTLQKACPAKTFEENFENCLVGKYAPSKIGEAAVHTPILPDALTGPAIFVSHGGEAFPSLILVLRGDGVTIDLTGQTFISKTGITSSTFKTVPDQPFSSFELTLPTGKYSALAAITDVCKPTKTETVKKKVSVKRHGKTVKVTKKVSETVAAPLLMPTEMVAQNGAVLKQSTKIAVTGCKAAKPVKKKKSKAKKKAKGKKK